MQRLNTLRDDRGAVAVWVAILMVPFMVMAGLAIDISAAHADRQRLQHGADAAALAIAQECAVSGCDDEDDTAQELAEANEPQGGEVTAEVVALDEQGGYVEVEASSSRDYWFAPVIGAEDISQTRVGAASWGYPTSARSIPLALSWCEIAFQTGAPVIRDQNNVVIGLDITESTGPVTMYNKGGPDHGCTKPNGQALPGGFSWLEGTGSCFDLHTSVGGWVDSQTGNNPKNCSPGDFRSVIGETVLFPVYDGTRGNGNNGEYRVFGYVAVKFEAFYFSGQYTTPTNPQPCGGNGRCIRGSIEAFVDLSGAAEFSPSGPQMGTAIVGLRLPEER